MTVYKTVLKQVKKDLPLITIYFFIFIVLSIATLRSKVNTKSALKAYTLDILIDDRTVDGSSEALLSFLKNENLHFKNLSDEEKNIAASNQTYELIITIPKDFKANVMANESDQIELLYYPSEYLSTYILKLNQYLGLLGYNEFDIQKTLNGMEIDDTIIFEDKAEDDNKYIYALYSTSYVLMSLIMFVVGFILKKFNDKALRDRIFISSVKRSQFNLQLVLAEFSLILAATFLMIGAQLLFGMGLSSEMLLRVIINFLVFALSILLLTNLLVSFCKTNSALTALVNVISLGMSFTSGGFVPEKIMNPAMLTIGKLFPQYYCLHNISEPGFTSSYFINLAIMLAMGGVYYMISKVLKRYKR